MRPASPGSTTYTNDILGNRTYRNPQSSTTVRYAWDEAGRMTKIAGSSDGATNFYRADGMRTKKVTGLTLTYIEEEESASGFYDEFQATNYPTWRYRYDGQMCFEEDFTETTDSAPVQSGTSYALGARGIDMLLPFSVNTSTYARTYGLAQFPIYDGHGNMTATLYRTGSSYDIANERTYDVWGGVRDGSASGDPNTRYCANLGHKQDDESATFVNGEPQGDGLIYMRARYYEPGTGRFVSEDPAHDGKNWYTYCANDPIANRDPSGQTVEAVNWLHNLMRQFGPLGEFTFGMIMTAIGGAVAKLTASVLVFGKELMASGSAEITLGMIWVRNAGWTGIVAGGVTSVVGLKTVARGILRFALGFNLVIASFIMAALFGDAMTEGGLL